ncbi:glycosyltransferase family 4 protein [Cytobacillus firmus]|uniref:glycosyltransferase family 4 protein n=1 Tax=Cytobacillus firmus TaxID=1399 RepID=UPI0024C16663|nr:glycosyltransferase family 4 protein [Cytobacillus firmus]WHY61506.1 glycosyltransferase family 4 protein [Cytobacillus firmus]
MKKVLIIGPLPPPIHGESMAIKSLVESNEIKNFCKLICINTNREQVNTTGKFALSKIYEDIRHILKAFSIVIFNKPDIIYLSISQTKLGLLRDVIFILLGSLRKKAKIITHLHGNNLGNIIDNLSSLELNFVSYALNKVDTGIVLGDSLKGNYRNLINRVEVVFNGIDKNFINDNELDIKFSNNHESEYINILYLSNLIESKGYLELILATINLIEKGYPIKLTLAGSIFNNVQFESVMEEVKRRKMDRDIIYRGVVQGVEKKELLLSSDIMILPTNYIIEGQPLSIIEGMAAGMPIISTKRGSIPDLVKENGILIDEGNKLQIENAIIQFLENKKFKLDSGKRSRKLFLQQFTLDNYISKIKSIFEL